MGMHISLLDAAESSNDADANLHVQLALDFELIAQKHSVHAADKHTCGNKLLWMFTCVCLVVIVSEVLIVFQLQRQGSGLGSIKSGVFWG